MERRFYDSAGAEAEANMEAEPVEESYSPDTQKAPRPRRDLVLAGIGACLVVVVMALFWFREDAPATDLEDRIRIIERQLQSQEQLLKRLNGIDERLSLMENRQQQLAVAADRIDRFESSLNAKLDAVGRELAALKQGKAEPAPSAPKSPPAAAKAPPAAVRTAPAVEHVVQPGETLYAIARRYGLTIEDLRRANNGIGADNTIHPGDKLIIRK